jgi:SAM-dependent methyltransferase
VTEHSRYVIRGGVQGRERLQVLSRLMQPATLALLQRAGVQPGMVCLDVGCGSGDVAFDLAGIVGATGRVLGTDLDEKKIELARNEAEARHLTNVEFRVADITRQEPDRGFDLVHARFILTHLSDPQSAVAGFWRALRPGGIVVVADIDFRGYFSYPECPALSRYVDLYTRTVERRGGDANIGPRLPGMLQLGGFENVQMHLEQVAGMTGEVKIMSPLTMENIADAVIAEGLATAEQIDDIVAELYEFARTPGTIASSPRFVEAWGTKPASA